MRGITIFLPSTSIGGKVDKETGKVDKETNKELNVFRISGKI